MSSKEIYENFKITKTILEQYLTEHEVHLQYVYTVPGTDQPLELGIRLCCSHYENTPIQIYRKFHLQKKIENFQI